MEHLADAATEDACTDTVLAVHVALHATSGAKGWGYPETAAFARVVGERFLRAVPAICGVWHAWSAEEAERSEILTKDFERESLRHQRLLFCGARVACGGGSGKCRYAARFFSSAVMRVSNRS